MATIFCQYFLSTIPNFLYEKIRHNIIPSQFGFQSSKSAVLQQLDFFETIKFGKFEQQYILYLDYAKGFDKVSVTALISKLSGFGLDDELLELLSAYVNDRHQHINFCDYLSKTIRVISGVKDRY